MMKRAFTLLELIVVIVIIGVLTTLGIIQYGKVVERGRSVEARSILGTLRKLQASYYLEHGSYCCGGVDSPDGLGLGVPALEADMCQPTHYFTYWCDPTSGACTAQRCSEDGYFAGGKPPGAKESYWITLYPDGHFEYEGTVP
ncbi:MAG: prepilin-type N-terminal cleavage/methylation domain-containing protein [Candidatus Omnitrophota bacterium]|jgi:prepilin-type N-terminal cleavage/methylation domain-containing protein